MLESILSLAILSTTVLLLQTMQIQMLKETKKDETEIQMLRVSYEEIRQRRLYDLPTADYTVERNGSFSVNYKKEPTAQIKIANKDQSWRIYREE